MAEHGTTRRNVSGRRQSAVPLAIHCRPFGTENVAPITHFAPTLVPNRRLSVQRAKKVRSRTRSGWCC